MSSEERSRGRDRGRDRADAQRRARPTREERIEARDARVAQRRLSGPGASEPIWSRPEPGVRRARLTREDIARAAVRVADAEGLDAASMRRIAGELGVGTMSLYYYVRTKDELFELMHDEMMGDLLIPQAELPEDWRRALEMIALRTREAFRRHPWSLDTPPATAGPNGLRHIEQSLAAVDLLDVDFATRFEIINMVDDYVFGFTVSELRDAQEQDSWDREGWADAVSPYIQSQLATGEFPHLAALVGEQSPTDVLLRLMELAEDRGRFARGLTRLLDGIELDVRARRPGKPARGVE